MGLKDIPPSDSNAILFRYKPYFTTKSNIGYSGLPSEHESSNFCQSPAPRRSTIHKFSLPHFLAIHLTRQSPFHGTPGHIGTRDGIDLSPSSTMNPFRHRSRAHPLARWFAGRSSTGHAQPCRPCIPLSCNSSDKAIAFLRASRAYPLARWHRFVSIERREPLQTALQGTSARAMVCRKKNSFAKLLEPNTRSTAEKSGATSD